MECVICKNGTTQEGKTTVSMHEEKCLIVFNNVKAEVCENCGEAYLNEATSQMLLEKAMESRKKGTELEIYSIAS